MTITINSPKHGFKEILFDDEDAVIVKEFTWAVSKVGYNFYALCTKKVNNKWTKVTMHRMLMNAPKGMDVDHKNHNTLDNRRSNLRIVCRTLNMLNQGIARRNENGFPGVLKRGNRFKASIRAFGKYIHGGYFDTAEMAFAKIQELKEKEFKKMAV